MYYILIKLKNQVKKKIKFMKNRKKNILTNKKV